MNQEARQQQEKDALEIIEEAVHQLRMAPPSLLAGYYVGSLPFILGLLFFWADMSRSAFAYAHCAEAALGLALLFLWMKCWQAVFAGKLHARICGDLHFSWSIPHVLRLMMTQIIIQPSSLFLLPIAAFIALPFGWVYAFYHDVSVLGAGESSDLKLIFRRAREQAFLWPKQNHVLIGIMFLFGLCVFLNLVIALIFVPDLLHRLLGIETQFTRSGVLAVFNTTFLLVAGSMTYLCMAPLMKAIYVLRCFYGESIRSGEDLKVELRQFERPTKKMTAVALLLLCLHLSLGVGLSLGQKNVGAGLKPAPTLAPQSTPMESFTQLDADGNGSTRGLTDGFQTSEVGVPASELNRSIDEVLNKREYTWRMPRRRGAVEQVHKGVFATFMERVINGIQKWLRTLKKMMEKLGEALERILRKVFAGNQRKDETSPVRQTSLRILIYGLLSITGAGLLIMAYRIWKWRRHRSPELMGQALAPSIDLADDNVMADQLPEDSWMNLARELMDRGDLRLALRALYLASLSSLAQRGMISIAKFKSHRDYERELLRRTYTLPELFQAFQQNVGTFEKAWYGMYDPNHEVLNQFHENLQRMRADARK